MGFNVVSLLLLQTHKTVLWHWIQNQWLVPDRSVTGLEVNTMAGNSHIHHRIKGGYSAVDGKSQVSHELHGGQSRRKLTGRSWASM